MTAKDLRDKFNWIFEGSQKKKDALERLRKTVNRQVMVLGDVVIWIEEHDAPVQKREGEPGFLIADTLPRVGSAVVILSEYVISGKKVGESERKLLLVKRDKEPYRGYWTFPGGEIRPYESIAEAAAREVWEEAKVMVSKIERWKTYEVINQSNGEHRIVVFSIAYNCASSVEPKAGGDASEAQFFSVEQLDDSMRSGRVRLTPLTSDVLKDLEESKWI